MRDVMEVLAELRLPQRWTELDARLSAPGDTFDGSLWEVERLTGMLGLPFTPKEYDDEDYWPVSRAEVYPDTVVRMSINRCNGLPGLRYRIAVDGAAGDDVERLVERLRPDLAPVPDLGERAYRLDALTWFVDLSRDVCRAYAAQFRAGLRRPDGPGLTVGARYEATVIAKSGEGVFVDLAGSPGFVPVEELGWFPIGDPVRDLRVGRTVPVAVLDVAPEVATASARAVYPDSWPPLIQRWPGDEWRDAYVNGLEPDNAARVTVWISGHLVPGLVPAEQLAGQRLPVGTWLRVRVASVDPTTRRIDLTLG